MKKYFFLILIFILCCAGLLNAQGVSKKWAIVQDLDDRIVYLDTTTIREYDNKITIWNLVIYREPKDINPLQQKVSQIKSQFMINSIIKKYSVIGTLYYDVKGKMIGETSIPNYNYTNENFSIAIVEGSTIDVLYNKAKDYLATGKFSDERSEFLKNFNRTVSSKNAGIQTDKNVKNDSVIVEKAKGLDEAAESKLKEVTQVAPPVYDSTAVKQAKTQPVKSETVKQITKQPAKTADAKKDSLDTKVSSVNKMVNSKIDSSKIKAALEKRIPRDSVALSKLKKDITIDKDKSQNPQKIAAVPEADKIKVTKPEEKKPAEKPAVKKNDEPKPAIISGYDFSKETNPSGVIFSDGKLFCFQVSSWKLKSQADKEVARLKAAGHNSFIQEAEVAKKGKWYRVRIGYFNTLEEALSYKKKVK